MTKRIRDFLSFLGRRKMQAPEEPPRPLKVGDEVVVLECEAFMHEGHTGTVDKAKGGWVYVKIPTHHIDGCFGPASNFKLVSKK